MGISGMFKLLRRHAPNSLQAVSLHTIEAQERIAVDVPGFLHAWVHVNPEPEFDLCHKALTYFARIARNGGVLIFDGASRQSKAPAREARAEARQKNQADLETARAALEAALEASEPGAAEAVGLSNRVLEMQKRCAYPTSVRIAEVADAMRAKGWNVHRALHDAEEAGAAMVREGRCTAMVTNDSDSIVWGCSVVYVRVGKDRVWTRITYDLVLRDLQLTDAQFVDLAIMMGSDFTYQTIGGIGPESALKMIKKHSTIENILAQCRAGKIKHRGELPATDEFDFLTARQVFGRYRANSLIYRTSAHESGMHGQDPTRANDPHQAEAPHQAKTGQLEPILPVETGQSEPVLLAETGRPDLIPPVAGQPEPIPPAAGQPEPIPPAADTVGSPESEACVNLTTPANIQRRQCPTNGGSSAKASFQSPRKRQRT